MNLFNSFILFVALSALICEAFFIFKAKTEPILFCLKVCPLYCSKRHKRDASQADHEPIYLDHEDDSDEWRDFPDDIEWSSHYHHHHPYYFCKPFPPHPPPPPPPMTTMPTTTEEPTYICELCKEKCHYPK